MAVFSGGNFNPHVDTVEEVSRVCVWDLVMDIDVLVFEKASLSAEPHVQSREGIVALSNPQPHFH